LRLRALQPDPLEPFDGIASPQQLAEVDPDLREQVAAVRVDVLAEQSDLAHAVAGEPLDLGDDLARPSALLAAAHRRDDAIGALRVAAHRDLHPRLEAALAVHRQIAREAALVEAEAATLDAEAAAAPPPPPPRDPAGAPRPP